jgi:hypothetical protein
VNDDLLNDFVNDSREHLTNIEADLLAIEEGGRTLTSNGSTRCSGLPIPLRAAAAFSG